MRRFLIVGLFGAGLVAIGSAAADSPEKKTKPTGGAGSDVEHVERAITARKEYEASLRALRDHYEKAGDKQRLQWTEQELMGFHLLFKPSYNLDVKDVPPPGLEAKVNVREANELFKQAMEFKGKGFGNDYVLNMRRAEVLLRRILE